MGFASAPEIRSIACADPLRRLRRFAPIPPEALKRISGADGADLRTVFQRGYRGFSNRVCIASTMIEVDFMYPALLLKKQSF
ncbi:MAG: hypothetical protein RR346_11540 [Bacteroidales bacterium]